MAIWQNVCRIEQLAVAQPANAASLAIREQDALPECLLVETALNQCRNVSAPSLSTGFRRGSIHVCERSILGHHRKRQSARQGSAMAVTPGVCRETVS